MLHIFIGNLRKLRKKLSIYKITICDKDKLLTKLTLSFSHNLYIKNEEKHYHVNLVLELANYIRIIAFALSGSMKAIKKA